MYLETDIQTIEDLKLFSRHDQKGIYDIYNNTFTRGGELLLEDMFRHPLCNSKAIAQRAEIISSFARFKTAFPFDAAVLDQVQKYLAHAKTIGDADKKPVLSEKEIQNGVAAVLQLFHQVRHFLEQGDISRIRELDTERLSVLTVLNDAALQPVFREKPGSKLSYAAVTAFDTLMRVKEIDKLVTVLNFIYKLDVFISVARIANERQFVFPVVHGKEKAILKLEGVYYPALASPVPNNFEMHSNKNVVFLTGANMAGKSTFLRSVGTAVYIAHMGFPVAAASMEFSVLNGVYTTINLPDNLGMGASHFYAEVLRVKKIATELKLKKSLFVIFDELFRGTNVKDAEEGTITVTEAFAGRKNSFFLISSHIVEAGYALKNKAGIGFHYLPTRMNGHTPEYTYTLEEGISADRHGMVIIQNEGILDILETGKKKG
jgi:Mismatch repair ATPase (MutS family)